MSDNNPKIRYCIHGMDKLACDICKPVSELPAPTLLGQWELETHKPEIYGSVLVWGILDGEQGHDTHEGYWDGRKWVSVRADDADANQRAKLHKVTHWMRRPKGPNEKADRSE